MANNQVSLDMLEFRLPDATTSVPTWDYLLSELTPFMEQLTHEINTQNSELDSINARIDYWLSKQTPSQQGE